MSPDEGFLLRLENKWLGRQIEKQNLADATNLAFPVFIKSLKPKQFTARVYYSAQELEAECHGLAPETEVIVSEVVSFEDEVRCFINRGTVATDSYLPKTENEREAFDSFIQEFLDAAVYQLPITCVIDIGHLKGYPYAAYADECLESSTF